MSHAFRAVITRWLFIAYLPIRHAAYSLSDIVRHRHRYDCRRCHRAIIDMPA